MSESGIYPVAHVYIYSGLFGATIVCRTKSQAWSSCFWGLDIQSSGVDAHLPTVDESFRTDRQWRICSLYPIRADDAITWYHSLSRFGTLISLVRVSASACQERASKIESALRMPIPASSSHLLRLPPLRTHIRTSSYVSYCPYLFVCKLRMYVPYYFRTYYQELYSIQLLPFVVKIDNKRLLSISVFVVTLVVAFFAKFAVFDFFGACPEGA